MCGNMTGTNPPRNRRFPQAALLEWWEREQRPLPWRADPAPWKTWVSEVMLQQTRVDTVVPYFKRFLELFPNPASLAKADSDTLMKSWEGLGYYQRARNLQRAVKLVMEQHGGEIPREPRAFAALPGAGPYITAAVMSIAFGRALPTVDGNVLRVIARYRGSRRDIRDPRERRRVECQLLKVIPRDRPGDFNQALMELGALVCTPRRPDCSVCPLAASCRARRLGLTETLPVRSRRRPAPEIDVAVAVVVHRKRLLVRRRPQGHLGGLWEFPGGRILTGESPREAIRRSISGELGMVVKVGEPIAMVHHAYTHFRIRMQVFRATCLSGPPKEAEDLRWILPAELEGLALPGANRKALPAILSGDGL